MTGNQINYLNYLETKRNNLVTSQEQGRHNLATESLSSNELKESHRTNLANEGIRRATNLETSKHNRETERQGQTNLIEQARHDAAMEYNQRYSADRSYAASNLASKRSQQASTYATNVKAASEASERSMRKQIQDSINAINSARIDADRIIARDKNVTEIQKKDMDQLFQEAQNLAERRLKDKISKREYDFKEKELREKIRQFEQTYDAQLVRDLLRELKGLRFK